MLNKIAIFKYRTRKYNLINKSTRMKQMTTRNQTIIIFVFHNFGLEP